eukprot:425104_1
MTISIWTGLCYLMPLLSAFCAATALIMYWANQVGAIFASSVIAYICQMQNNGNACQGVVMCIGYPFARRSMRYGINLFHANGDHDGSLTIDIIKTGKLWARISMHFCLILQISRRFGCGVCSKYSFNTGLVSEMHWTQKRDTERAIELIFENKHLLEQMELFESLKGIHCFIYWANLNHLSAVDVLQHTDLYPFYFGHSNWGLVL